MTIRIAMLNTTKLLLIFNNDVLEECYSFDLSFFQVRNHFARKAAPELTYFDADCEVVDFAVSIPKGDLSLILSKMERIL